LIEVMEWTAGNGLLRGRRAPGMARHFPATASGGSDESLSGVAGIAFAIPATDY